MPRAWSGIPIHDRGEPLIDLPESLLRLVPHPYVSLGAPYGTTCSPFRLRQAVIERLLRAQDWLGSRSSPLRLAIFDAWRPLAVQRFMVAYAFHQECLLRGLDPRGHGPDWDLVAQEVGRFWAPPSDNPATPPPHSTGGAVDLTLADVDGRTLDMGGAIDAIGAISEPLHHAAAATADPSGDAAQWHRRRCLLAEAMASAGFAQHPNEWWHFSYGDQLWAWRVGQGIAFYGRSPDPDVAGA